MKAPEGWPIEAKERPKTYNVTIRVDQETHERLGALAAEQKVSRAQAMVALINHPRAIEHLDEVEVAPKQWRISHGGKTQSANAWAKDLGIPVSTILYRLNKGLPTEQVLSTTPLSGNKGGVAVRFGDLSPRDQLVEQAGHSHDEWIVGG